VNRLQDHLTAIACAAVDAPSLAAFRSRALSILASGVRFDAALFHALSPRVPLETAVLVGIDPGRLASSMAGWDRLAVDLGRLREVALERGGVASDREAFAPGTRGRARFEAEIVRPLGMRALVIAHLSVRAAIRSAVVLLRKRAEPFADPDLELLRGVVPVLAAGDALHAELDRAPTAALRTRTECVDQRLTERQREIVEYVAMGYTNQAIAGALGLSANTLRNHLAETFRRLGASNRADVVRLAVLRSAPRA
jgi:DNA-binding CsgD family transcriptional regulator